MILLNADESDSLEYVEQVRAAILGAAVHYGARDVYVVKINNWFGRRWLAPQRKFGSSNGADNVDNFFQPTRLEGESTWMRFL